MRKVLAISIKQADNLRKFRDVAATSHVQLNSYYLGVLDGTDVVAPATLLEIGNDFIIVEIPDEVTNGIH